MPSVAQNEIVTVIVGIDTHKDTHVAVAIDTTGRRLGELITPATVAGYDATKRWAKDLGEIGAFGIEGTGSFGAGLCRYLHERGHRVVEVNRPDRAERRRRGKSDPLDAEVAARAVLAGTATAVPKISDDQVEMIRLVKVARNTAMKARTQAAATIQSMLCSLPDALREQLSGISTVRMVRTCSRFRPREIDGPLAAAKMALRSIARRYEELESEIKVLDGQLDQIVLKAAPTLTELFGVGTEVAATLLVAAGDNPDRLASEASFASLCGVSPVPASSGKTHRHRLNRGGNRQANAALHKIVLSRLRWQRQTQEYMARRRSEGLSKREIIRCLKRFVAREIYRALIADGEYRSALRSAQRAA